MPPNSLDNITHPMDSPALSPAGLREKILFTLKHYPVLTPSMIQIGLGPAISPRDWRPVLEQLIREGVVKRETQEVISHIQHYRQLTKIFLASPDEHGTQSVELKAA